MKSILQRVSNFPKDYLKEIEETYIRCRSVQNIAQWFRNLDSLSIAVEKGTAKYQQVESLIFELKVMSFIINSRPDCKITYEPVGELKNGKKCDLLINSDKNYLIELKTFFPENRSTPIPYKHITEGNELIMDGYSYHQRQATMGHLVDQTHDAEEKMSNYIGKYINVMGVLVGFYLHLESFRDFITIYRTRKYRWDDAFGKMTVHNLKKDFIGNINEFWSFPFYQIGFDFEKDENPVSVALSKNNDQIVKL